MIVRSGPGVLHLITQPDHAALARRIMEHWSSLAKAERRRDILAAIEHHDRGWAEPDAAVSVDPATATIRDFVAVPADVRQSVWPRSVAALAPAPWAAALVAHHAVTVYDRYRQDAAWHDFFPAMTARRDEHLARATAPQSLGPWTIRLTGAQVQVTPNPFAIEGLMAVSSVH